MNRFIIVIFVLFISGCAYQTYEELEVEYAITGDDKKLRKREAMLIQAEEFFENKELCEQSDKHTWICTNIRSGTRIKRNTKALSIDGVIREHLTERANGCGCATQEDMRRFLKELERILQ